MASLTPSMHPDLALGVINSVSIVFWRKIKMSLLLKAGSIGGSIVVLIALLITFFESLLAFVGFLTIALKAIVVLAFIAVFAAVGFLTYKAWQGRRQV